MPLLPTSDQVLALAPDAQISGAARGLASPQKWLTLGLNDEAAWGECTGSGQQPYQVLAQLAGPAFHCSCPSRKRPCKHALALLLLIAKQAPPSSAEAPDWVRERLAVFNRRPRAADALETPRPPTKTDATQTAARRETRVAAGMDELSLWLADLVRRGLAAAQTQPPRFWESMAAHLVDAQAPGAARLVRALGGLPASGPAWPERLTAGLGQLHLLVEGYARLDSLPADLQADVRARLGFTLQHDALLKEPGLRDCWQVLGRRVVEEDRLRAQRVWLWGERSQRPALILSYAAPGQALDTRLLPGTALQADLVFFPSAFPLRALLKSAGAAERLDRLPSHIGVARAAAVYGGALARNPWIESFPAAIDAVTPVRLDDAWWVRDAAGDGWPLAPDFTAAWSLLALSGGTPRPVFGEWDGEAFWPLSAWADGRLVLLDV